MDEAKNAGDKEEKYTPFNFFLRSLIPGSGVLLPGFLVIILCSIIINKYGNLRETVNSFHSYIDIIVISGSPLYIKWFIKIFLTALAAYFITILIQYLSDLDLASSEQAYLDKEADVRNKVLKELEDAQQIRDSLESTVASISASTNFTNLFKGVVDKKIKYLDRFIESKDTVIKDFLPLRTLHYGMRKGIAYDYCKKYPEVANKKRIAYTYLHYSMAIVIAIFCAVLFFILDVIQIPPEKYFVLFIIFGAIWFVLYRISFNHVKHINNYFSRERRNIDRVVKEWAKSTSTLCKYILGKVPQPHIDVINSVNASNLQPPAIRQIIINDYTLGGQVISLFENYEKLHGMLYEEIPEPSSDFSKAFEYFKAGLKKLLRIK